MNAGCAGSLVLGGIMPGANPEYIASICIPICSNHLFSGPSLDPINEPLELQILIQ